MSALPPSSGDMIQIPRGQPGGMTARRTAAGEELEFSGETAGTVLAETARAQVEARFVMSRRFPRDIMQVRQKMLAACARPRFAEKAIYRKPVGDKKIEGASIRLAEEAARCMGNLDTAVITIYDDRDKRIVIVEATDLEANLRYPMTVSVEKTVERRKLREGQLSKGQRINSYGDIVYLVEATDDDVLNKANNLISKALRNCILRLVPGDILEEAMDACRATMRNRDAKDPKAELKRMTDAFSNEFGITAGLISEYLGHGVDQATIDDIQELREIFTTMRSGETTWKDVMATRDERREPKEPELPAGGEGTPAATTQTPAAAASAAASASGSTPPAAAGQRKPNLADVGARAKEQREGSGKKLQIQTEAGPVTPPAVDDDLLSRGRSAQTAPPGRQREPGDEG